ncbi:hypothetical protein LMG9964_00276 [Paraburkholderia phenoliruptrix]|uniref:Uncharacterized protein n=1 Tax=Paraburkholderia phenoliruptrix TaxID=252970 RepID=A0A6J5K0W3_9BURK|nr:hypothetical protein LMG9964_00276 [Paraburkholderia phenoliruptrix]
MRQERMMASGLRGVYGVAPSVAQHACVRVRMRGKGIHGMSAENPPSFPPRLLAGKRAAFQRHHSRQLDGEHGTVAFVGLHVDTSAVHTRDFVHDMQA